MCVRARTCVCVRACSRWKIGASTISFLFFFLAWGDHSLFNCCFMPSSALFYEQKIIYLRDLFFVFDCRRDNATLPLIFLSSTSSQKFPWECYDKKWKEKLRCPLTLNLIEANPLKQWFLTFFAPNIFPWTPKLSKCNTCGTFNTSKRGLEGYNTLLLWSSWIP